MASLLFALLFSVSQIFGSAMLNQNQTKYKPLTSTLASSGAVIDPTVASNSQVAYATIFSEADTLSGLIVQLDKAPGTGQSYTQTLWVNGSATNVSVTISGNSDSGSDYTNTATISPGDLAAWKITTSSGFPYNTNATYSVKASQ